MDINVEAVLAECGEAASYVNSAIGTAEDTENADVANSLRLIPFFTDSLPENRSEKRKAEGSGLRRLLHCFEESARLYLVAPSFAKAVKESPQSKAFGVLQSGFYRQPRRVSVAGVTK